MAPFDFATKVVPHAVLAHRNGARDGSSDLDSNPPWSLTQFLQEVQPPERFTTGLESSRILNKRKSVGSRDQGRASKRQKVTLHGQLLESNVDAANDQIEVKDVLETHEQTLVGDNDSKILLGRVQICLDFTEIEQHKAATLSAPVQLIRIDQNGASMTLYLARPWNVDNQVVLRSDKVAPGVLQALETCVSGLEPDEQAASEVLGRLESQTSTVTFEIFWKDGWPAQTHADSKILASIFPDIATVQTEPWVPRDFYESVHTPPKDTAILFDSDVDSDLYPFQKRTVRWMLAREGVTITSSGTLVEDDQARTAFSMSHAVTDIYQNKVYCNPVAMTVSTTPPLDTAPCSGGILAEEMGLGKTIEIAALITSHPRTHQEPSAGATQQSKATLIIAPSSILQQWKNELAQHAPKLAVFHYEGMAVGKSRTPDDDAEIADSMTWDYDVVLTTYQVLTREIHFAVEPPKREMRRGPRYERRKCPLMQLEWWRICLDEAQMVDTGVSAAAKVACQLPRVHSWAVSGTPVRRNVEDLYGLMVFLRMEPFASRSYLWHQMLQHRRDTARRLFDTIALRHTKAQVREDIQLPPQKRVVLNLPFTTVEHQHYLNLYEEMCEEVGVNSDGSPASGDWNPEDGGTVALMRTWLGRLRRTCLNPQLPMRGGRRIGKQTGPLRTVEEVLDAMIDQNEVYARIEERAAVQCQIRAGNIQAFAGDMGDRAIRAKLLFESAMQRSLTMVEQARQRLQLEEAALTQRQLVKDADDDEAENILGRHRVALRAALGLLHTCVFFMATTVYQIKANEHLTDVDSDEFQKLDQEESDFYDQAKAIRKEVLHDSQQKAEKQMRSIRALRNDGQLVTLPRLQDIQRMGGIGTRGLIEKSYGLFDTIRKVGDKLIEWRSKMIDILLLQLMDKEAEDNQITGDEYEQSTLKQDELYVYFDAFKALLADLKQCITGESSGLLDVETKSLLRAAKRYLDPDIQEGMKVQTHAPELTIELFTFRLAIRDGLAELGSVRGLIADARRLQDPAYNRESAEATIASRITAHLQKVLKEYSKEMPNLEDELGLFRSAQNSRLAYYKEVQELSADVEPYKEQLEETLDQTAYDAAVVSEVQHSAALAQLRTKHRFLTHLKEESGNESETRICVICRCSFDDGVLTVCGHQYCKDCIQAWWREHRNCPVCKRHLNLVDFHNITYKPRAIKAQEEEAPAPASPQSSPSTSADSRQASIYSEIDNSLMVQIKSFDLPRSYGTKIDTLARHLLWIREHDPGAKSIVFTQYREFLDVLCKAFSDFKIGYTRLGANNAVEQFRKEASRDCLLLDAKTDSSGLTLVNATHVFICEPLVQTAVELQAIARVHRIGQTRPTTVWMYLVNDTVEESIYAISKERRLAQLKAKSTTTSGISTPLPLGEQAIDKANSEELQTAQLSRLLESGKTGGEVVSKELLWECLFGNAKKATAVVQEQPQAEVQADLDRELRAFAGERRRAREAVDA